MFIGVWRMRTPVASKNAFATAEPTAAVGGSPEPVSVQPSLNASVFPALTSVFDAPGTTVTWSNDDGAPHGLAFNDAAQGTDLLLPGATFNRTYDKPGTFDYVCAVHAYMTGKVIVR